MNQLPVEDNPGQEVRGYSAKIESPKTPPPPTRPVVTPPVGKIEFELETYTPLEKGNFGHFIHHEPYIFNQQVGVKRYRIIVQEIPEPEHVIRERLIKLWQDSRNMHHNDAIRQMAKRLGIVLPPKNPSPRR